MDPESALELCERLLAESLPNRWAHSHSVAGTRGFKEVLLEEFPVDNRGTVELVFLPQQDHAEGECADRPDR
jgi:hypothetical protein